MQDVFYAADVRRLTGLTYRQLDYIARSGVLTPGVADSEGKGSRRLFNFRDVIAIRVVSELRRCGFRSGSLQTIARFVQRSRQLASPKDLRQGHLVTDGEEVLITKGRDGLQRVLSRIDRACWILPLQQLATGVAE